LTSDILSIVKPVSTNIELIASLKCNLKRNKISTFKFMEEDILPNKKDSKRGRETLFRATYQNQSNLIQMADNKANIIISINTMIISSIIAIPATAQLPARLIPTELMLSFLLS